MAVGGGLRKDDLDDVGPVEGPRAAQERFQPVVVLVAAEHELVCGKCPAGKRPRGLLDVLLAKVTDPQRKQLHEFPRVVLVGLALPVAVVIKVTEHCGVL